MHNLKVAERLIKRAEEALGDVDGLESEVAITPLGRVEKKQIGMHVHIGSGTVKLAVTYNEDPDTGDVVGDILLSDTDGSLARAVEEAIFSVLAARLKTDLDTYTLNTFDISVAGSEFIYSTD